MTEDGEQIQVIPDVVPEASDGRKPARVNVIKFSHEIDIYPDARLPDYDVGEIKAYRAAGRDKSDYFALVCERHLVPRIRNVPGYAGLSNSFLVPLAADGVVRWPNTNQQHYVLVYKDVLGKRLLQGPEQAMGWRQDEVTNIFIRPIVSALIDFRNRDFAHGNICPANMFHTSAGPKPEKITLGECLAAPASYTQPILYQTIERGLASPVGRGEATATDDIYAFGVCVATLMRQNDPLTGMSDEEIVRAKIEQGSYAAITGNERFKGSILELLRGVLHDDPGQRWTLEEILVWMDGRRLSPKQSLKEKRAPRPVTFAGEKYFQSTLLAMNLGAHAPEVVTLIETEELQQWLTRSVEDDKLLERVENAIKSTRDKGTGPGYDERLAANLSIALDAKAPIRYKGLHLTGDGIGKSMAQAMVLKRDLNPYVELFSQNIAFNWVASQEGEHLDIGALISRFDSCRNFIRHNKIGYGVERCVYILCPDIHCLSEKISDYFVTTPEGLLMAFEDISRKGYASPLFFDRHSAAFLSVKDAKAIDSYLFDLASNEEHKKILANLRALALIQQRSTLPALTGIAKVFMDSIDVLCVRYHDREVRDKLKKSLARYASEGDLVKMANVLGNSELMARDLGLFREAMREYALLNREYHDLEISLNDRTNFGKAMGHGIASLISSAMAVVIIIAITFMFFTRTQIY